MNEVNDIARSISGLSDCPTASDEPVGIIGSFKPQSACIPVFNSNNELIALAWRMEQEMTWYLLTETAKGRA